MAKVTAVEVRRGTKAVAELLKKNMKALESVLPAHMDAPRLCRIALNAIQKLPALAGCTPSSFLMAVINCGESGLEPVLGQAALIPYKGVVQFQPMYQGLCNLVRNTGQVVTIYAEVVRDGDEFSYSKGLERNLEHVPKSNNNGALTHAYAVAEMANGTKNWVLLEKRDVEKIMRSSPSHKFDDSPWKKWPEAMWRKTAIKQICKTLPKSVELSAALTHDTTAELGGGQRPISADLGQFEGLDPDEATPAPSGGNGPQRKKRNKEKKGDGDAPPTAQEDDAPKEPEEGDPSLPTRDELLEELGEMPRGPVTRAAKHLGVNEVAPKDLGDEQLAELVSLARAG